MKSWTVEPLSEFEAYFLEDRAIQEGWFVSFTQHPKFGDGWLAFRNPAKTLVALDLSDLSGLLDEVGFASENGLYAAGFVGFDAAPAFDPAFTSHRREDIPLACFHMYENPPVFYKELLCTLRQEELDIDWVPELEREAFLEQCRKIKEHLAAGDTYQVNLSLRFKGQHESPLASVFANLAAENPPPYAGLFLSKEVHVGSLSPELFFERSGANIRCRPMKGTAPVGKDPLETAVNATRLQSSEKDRAENLMILDMIRNDLGRIAEIGTVKATSVFKVEAFQTVLQMTSTVEAEVRLSLKETFQALFPCASIVGAPKVQTMGIIQALETSPRGVYTGAIGVVLPGQKAKFSVAIRTMFQRPGSGESTYGAGSGIVWDSVPESEWRETLLKTEALRHPSPEWLLIETFSPDGGRIELHLDRMETSAHALGIPFDRRTAVAALEGAEGRVRLLLNCHGEFRVECSPLGEHPGLLRARPAPEPVLSKDPSLRFKTNRRSLYDKYLSGVDEVLLWNEREEATEFCRGNLVACIQGKFVTPPVECGLLPGVLRGELLRAGHIKEKRVDLEALFEAEQVWRINSLSGWAPVRLMEMDVD